MILILGLLKNNYNFKIMSLLKQKIQFGKYKGKFVSWLLENDYQYAIWLLKQSNSTTKTKRAVQSFIDKNK